MLPNNYFIAKKGTAVYVKKFDPNKLPSKTEPVNRHANELQEALAAMVRAKAISCDINMETMAEIANVDVKTIYNFKNGRNVNFEIGLRILRAFDIVLVPQNSSDIFYTRFCPKH